MSGKVARLSKTDEAGIPLGVSPATGEPVVLSDLGAYAGKTLLVAGDPGCGKTATLVKLGYLLSNQGNQRDDQQHFVTMISTFAPEFEPLARLAGADGRHVALTASEDLSSDDIDAHVNEDFERCEHVPVLSVELDAEEEMPRLSAVGLPPSISPKTKSRTTRGPSPRPSPERAVLEEQLRLAVQNRTRLGRRSESLKLTIGQIARQLHHDHGFSQNSIAEVVGVSGPYINKLMKQAQDEEGEPEGNQSTAQMRSLARLLRSRMPQPGRTSHLLVDPVTLCAADRELKSVVMEWLSRAGDEAAAKTVVEPSLVFGTTQSMDLVKAVLTIETGLVHAYDPASLLANFRMFLLMRGDIPPSSGLSKLIRDMVKPNVVEKVGDVEEVGDLGDIENVENVGDVGECVLDRHYGPRVKPGRGLLFETCPRAEPRVEPRTTAPVPVSLRLSAPELEIIPGGATA